MNKKHVLLLTSLLIPTTLLLGTTIMTSSMPNVEGLVDVHNAPNSSEYRITLDNKIKLPNNGTGDFTYKTKLNNEVKFNIKTNGNPNVFSSDDTNLFKLSYVEGDKGTTYSVIKNVEPLYGVTSFKIDYTNLSGNADMFVYYCNDENLSNKPSIRRPESGKTYEAEELVKHIKIQVYCDPSLKESIVINSITLDYACESPEIISQTIDGVTYNLSSDRKSYLVAKISKREVFGGPDSLYGYKKPIFIKNEVNGKPVTGFTNYFNSDDCYYPALYIPSSLKSVPGSKLYANKGTKIYTDGEEVPKSWNFTSSSEYLNTFAHYQSCEIVKHDDYDLYYFIVNGQANLVGYVARTNIYTGPTLVYEVDSTIKNYNVTTIKVLPNCYQTRTIIIPESVTNIKVDNQVDMPLILTPLPKPHLNWDLSESSNKLYFGYERNGVYESKDGISFSYFNYKVNTGNILGLDAKKCVIIDIKSKHIDTPLDLKIPLSIKGSYVTALDRVLLDKLDVKTLTFAGGETSPKQKIKILKDSLNFKNSSQFQYAIFPKEVQRIEENGIKIDANQAVYFENAAVDMTIDTNGIYGGGHAYYGLNTGWHYENGKPTVGPANA